MLKRYWPGPAPLTIPLMMLVLMAVPARGQDAPVTDEQALQDQVQQTVRQIVQNMIAKGIDPRQSFQQMQTDPADIAKRLVDQGLIDQESLARLQTNTQKMSTGRIRAQLEVSDAEWAVLDPMIRKVLTAQATVQRASGTMGGGGMRAGLMGGFMAVQTPAGADLSRAVRALRAALDSRNASAGEVATALATLRDARGRATAEVAAAQADLASAVTVRQEGVLASMGILE